MKKLFTALCAAVMTACAMAAPVSAETQKLESMRDEIFREGFHAMPVYALGDDLSLYEKGDVNLDGEVNAKDVNLILHEYNLYSVVFAGHIMDDAQRELADVFADETDNYGDDVNAKDARIVLCYTNFRMIGNDVTVEAFLDIWNNQHEKIIAAGV